MIVRGTTETRDELTGNFGSALEDASISDYRLIALFAEKTLNAIFGVLQHYRGYNGSAVQAGALPSLTPTRTWPGNFAVTHKTLPFGDVLECLLDLREDL